LLTNKKIAVAGGKFWLEFKFSSKNGKKKNKGRIAALFFQCFFILKPICPNRCEKGLGAHYYSNTNGEKKNFFALCFNAPNNPLKLAFKELRLFFSGKEKKTTINCGALFFFR
jgi:hypothetical protein